MAFTEKDMIKLGLKEISPGKWEKAPTIKTIQLKTVIKSNAVKRGRTSNSELPVKDSISCLLGHNPEGHTAFVGCRIILAGVIKGLNSSGGLMRSHWTKISKEKELFVTRIAVLDPPMLKGQVKMTLTRHTTRLMDWENLASTIKLPNDALVQIGVIEDDSPKFIVEFITRQFLCRKKDQRTEIFIETIK